MKNKGLVLVLIFSIMMFNGCKSSNANKIEVDPYENIPEQFAEIIKVIDQDYESRNIELEDEVIYRCYEINETDRMYIVRTGGYEEDMLISVTMNDMNILKVGVLYENETDKYGEHVHSDWFLDRFLLSNSQPIVLVKRKKSHENEVIAITGATITSQAVVDAVNKCIDKTEGKK